MHGRAWLHPLVRHMPLRVERPAILQGLRLEVDIPDDTILRALKLRFNVETDCW